MDAKRAEEISKAVCDATTDAILYGNFGRLEDTAVNLENSMEGTLADVDCCRAEFDDRGATTVFFHPIGKGTADGIADDFCEYVADLDDPPFDLIEKTFAELDGKIAALPRGGEIDIPFYTEDARGIPGLAKVLVKKVSCAEAVAEAKRMVREKASEIVCSCLAEGPGAMVRASSALGDESGIVAASCRKVSVTERDGNGGSMEVSTWIPVHPWSGDSNPAEGVMNAVRLLVPLTVEEGGKLDDACLEARHEIENLEYGSDVNISIHSGKDRSFDIGIGLVPCIQALEEADCGRESPRA